MKTLSKYFVIALIGLMSFLAFAPGSLWAQGTPVQVRSGSAGAIGNGVITPLGNTNDPKCSATDSTQEGAICLLKQTIFQLANVLAQLQATLSIAGTVQPGNTPNTTPWLFTPNDGAGHSMPAGDATGRSVFVRTDATPANANQPAVTSDSVGCATDIGCEISDASGNKITSNSTTYTAKHALDGNMLGTLGTAFTTPGKVDTKSADGDNATVGAKTDAANPAVDATGVSVVAILKELSKLSQGSWAGGALKSGAVTTAMTGTTSTSVIPGVASNYLYITQCTTSNSSLTVSTDIILQDGSGGTTLYTILAPAAAVATTGGGGGVFIFPTPLKVPTLANGLFAANVTTGSSTKISCSGFASTVSY